MLNNEQLNIILTKQELNDVDIILLQDHVDYIGNIKEEYEEIPSDVFNNLQEDLRLIILRLKKEYTRLTGTVPFVK